MMTSTWSPAEAGRRGESLASPLDDSLLGLMPQPKDGGMNRCADGARVWVRLCGNGNGNGDGTDWFDEGGGAGAGAGAEAEPSGFPRSHGNKSEECSHSEFGVDSGGIKVSIDLWRPGRHTRLCLACRWIQMARLLCLVWDSLHNDATRVALCVCVCVSVSRPFLEGRGTRR